MPRRNHQVAELLQELADLVAITEGEGFKVRAYERAARSVAGHPADVSTLDSKQLRAIPNVGKAVADKIQEFFRTGQVGTVERLRAQIPAGVRALTTIRSLGPKRATALYQELGVSSVEELSAAIEQGRLTELRGFGARSAEKLRLGIELLQRGGGRVMVSVAMAAAEEIVAALATTPGCRGCAYAGSLRRMAETIGDLDVLVAATDSEPAMAAFVALPVVAEVIARGPTKTSVRTVDGLQVDLRVVPPDSWGAALQYFTGSKEHNVKLREMAVRQGLKLSEYGLFEVADGGLVASATEEEIYQRLGLPWIPPTLREDRGEIEAALAGELPAVLSLPDIRGDLHTHTDLTDGVAPAEQMLAAAHARGYEYYAVTDHAKNLPMQRMTDEKMLAQRVLLRQLAAGVPGLTVLHGTELNIDPDGGVDWDDDFLAGFDLCVAAIHSHFDQSPDELTRRLVRACEHPYVNVIGHPSTRMIGRREPIEPDWDQVFAAAARTGTALEVNSFPDRLDLGDELIRRARRHGARFAVNTDSHATGHLDHLRYGVATAQRGWLTRDEVINAWPLDRLRAFVAAKRG